MESRLVGSNHGQKISRQAEKLENHNFKPPPPQINDLFSCFGLKHTPPHQARERADRKKTTSLNLGGGGGGGGGRGIFRFFGNVHMVPKDPKIGIRTIVDKIN